MVLFLIYLYNIISFIINSTLVKSETPLSHIIDQSIVQFILSVFTGKKVAPFWNFTILLLHNVPCVQEHDQIWYLKPFFFTPESPDIWNMCMSTWCDDAHQVSFELDGNCRGWWLKFDERTDSSNARCLQVLGHKKWFDILNVFLY